MTGRFNYYSDADDAPVLRPTREYQRGALGSPCIFTRRSSVRDAAIHNQLLALAQAQAAHSAGRAVPARSAALGPHDKSHRACCGKRERQGNIGDDPFVIQNNQIRLNTHIAHPEIAGTVPAGNRKQLCPHPLPLSTITLTGGFSGQHALQAKSPPSARSSSPIHPANRFSGCCAKRPPCLPNKPTSNRPGDKALPDHFHRLSFSKVLIDILVR